MIEKDLDEYFLTAVLHEIGNVLGLGDIRTREDLQSIMEDPYDEIFICGVGDDGIYMDNKGNKYGVDDSGYTTQAAFFDYDNDTDKDFIIMNGIKNRNFGGNQKNQFYLPR